MKDSIQVIYNKLTKRTGAIEEVYMLTKLYFKESGL